MFAPVGYRPLAELWDEFLSKRLDDLYRSAASYYASPDFDCVNVRGTPLDICHHLFLSRISLLKPVLASPENQVVNLRIYYRDGTDHLFAAVPPYFSALYQAACALDAEQLKVFKLEQGRFFEPWHGESNEPALWSEAFPQLDAGVSTLPTELEESLRFSCLATSIDRDHYLIPRQMPVWSRLITDTQTTKTIIENFGGWAICLPESSLDAWSEYLEAAQAVSENDVCSIVQSKTGRPRVQGKIRDAYLELGLDRRQLGFKETHRLVEQKLGITVSESSLRRAIRKRD